jgi:hypothetical protein
MVSLPDRVLAHLELATARGRRWSTVPMIAREMWLPTNQVGGALAELARRRELMCAWPAGVEGETRYGLPKAKREMETAE